MCDVYELSKPLIGVSGKMYYHIETLGDAADIFGVENLFLCKDPLYTTINDIDDIKKLITPPAETCLCPLNTKKLLEMGNLKYKIDFKLEYEDWENGK